MANLGKYENPLKLFSLGSLESEVLTVICEQGGGSVREVRSRLSRPLAYTTVMTTLDRLYKKDLLERRRAGRGFRYSPRISGKPEIGPDTSLVAGRWPFATGKALISYLLNTVGTYDEALLQDLEKTIATRRQQFEPKEKI